MGTTLGRKRIVPSKRDKTKAAKWRRPRQRISGARIDRYRCFLPDLAGFSIYRRGGANGATMNFETGGEGGIRTREAGFSRLHTFQACSFDRSDTSPRK